MPNAFGLLAKGLALGRKGGLDWPVMPDALAQAPLAVTAIRRGSMQAAIDEGFGGGDLIAVVKQMESAVGVPTHRI